MRVLTTVTSLPPDGDYVVTNSLNLGDVVLKEGDHLPADSILRTMQGGRRLANLVDQRRLKLVLTPATVAPKAMAAAASVGTKDLPDFDSMAIAELRTECKNRGLEQEGNARQLRKRLNSLVG